jgi:DNA-binding GntR family transcriptional regulator
MNAAIPALAARAPLYEEVAERLRERIFARALEPGQWIDEQSLAVELGISRTPMREALKVLAAEGLVTMKPRRGAYVTEVSERDVADVYQMLALLESDAAAAVASRVSTAELAELQTLHAQLEASVTDHARFFALNEAFHVRILAIAGNRWRAQMAGDLRKLMKLSRHHSLFRKGRIEASLAEHRALLQALRRRDAAGAAALTREHFANGLAAAAPSPAGTPPKRPSAARST